MCSMVFLIFLIYMEKPSTIGELLDESSPFAFIPILNTIFLPIALIVALNICLYEHILKEFIEKIRKIKL